MKSLNRYTARILNKKLKVKREKTIMKVLSKTNKTGKKTKKLRKNRIVKCNLV